MGDGDILAGGGGGRELCIPGTGGGAFGGLGGAAEWERVGGGGGAGILRVCCGMLETELEGRRACIRGAEGGREFGKEEESLASAVGEVSALMRRKGGLKGAYRQC